MQPVFRFAPSPNGFLHLGHAYSALLNARLAKETGGRFLLRIEDIDTVRCTPDKVVASLEDLAWLGLAWEQPVLQQSAHFTRYRAVAAALEGRGLVYPCFCTRGDIAQAPGASAHRDPDGVILYPGTCRGMKAEERAARIAGGEAYALRLDMTAALRAIGSEDLSWHEVVWREASSVRLEEETVLRFDAENWGDVVLVRKDCPTSYHLSVVLDDALQGITHVVRGADLYAATGIHRVLQLLLGLPAPRYCHHGLIRDDDGKKLAKSAASMPLRTLRAQGATPQEIRTQLGFG